jgi:hypothetical protein
LPRRGSYRSPGAPERRSVTRSYPCSLQRFRRTGQGWSNRNASVVSGGKGGCGRGWFQGELQTARSHFGAMRFAVCAFRSASRGFATDLDRAGIARRAVNHGPLGAVGVHPPRNNARRTTRHDTHSVAGQTRGEAVRSSECRLYSRNATNGSTRVARRAGPYPAAAATGSSRAAIVPYVTGSVYWMAFQMNGYVATDCPRYCGRKPYSTTWPRPCLTSTSAALPLSFDPPRSQPDNSGLPVAG